MSSQLEKFFTCPQCNLRSRHEIAQEYFTNFLNRTDSMFKWTGLPDSIPEYILERYLKVNGWCGIGLAPSNAQKHAGELVCFFGSLGNVPDLYYQPTSIILANPVLGTKEYNIGEDCVWAKNDSTYKGIAHILSRYSHLLAENDISINIAQITTRMPFVFTAETESEKQSAEKYIQQAEEGKIGIIKSSALNNGITPQPTVTDSSGSHIKALIELHQYLKAQCNNDLGIGSNFNMKRERMSTAEVENNSPYLLPLVDEMLKFRNKICEEVNAMFPGQNWSVDLDSAWELEDKQQTLEVEALEEPSSQLESEGGDPNDGNIQE